MSRAARLYDLQRIDSEAEEKQHRLTEIAAALVETEALLQARESTQKAAEQTQYWAVRQRDMELEVQGLKSEITASEKRLYSGSLRNPKEMADLQAKGASLRRLLEKKEESLLESMINRDDAEATQVSAQAFLEQVEASWVANQAALRSEKEQLEARLSELAQHRETVLPNILPDDLDHYQFLRRTKAGQVVAIFEAKSCTACGMEMPQGLMERGREAGLLSCGNCGRILVPHDKLRR